MVHEDLGMIGFDDFENDFNEPFEEDQNKLGDEMFNDFGSEIEGSASIAALTLKDGVNYEDDRYDDIMAT